MIKELIFILGLVIFGSGLVFYMLNIGSILSSMIYSTFVGLGFVLTYLALILKNMKGGKK